MTETDARKALTRVPSGMAAEMLGVTVATLRNWHKRGKIEAERTRAGRLLWDVAGYLESESKAA
jgi:predicted site-specific integrase-resolvase